MKKRIIVNLIIGAVLMVGAIFLSASTSRIQAATDPQEYKTEYMAFVVKHASEAVKPGHSGNAVNYSNAKPNTYAWQVKIYDQAWGATLAEETWIVSEFETLQATATGAEGDWSVVFEFNGTGRIKNPNTDETGRALLNHTEQLSSGGMIRQYDVNYYRFCAPSICSSIKEVFLDETVDKAYLRQLADSVEGKSDWWSGDSADEAGQALFAINGNSVTYQTVDPRGLNNYFYPTKWVIKGTIN